MTHYPSNYSLPSAEEGIRLVILGDHSVGKTSLIITLVSERFTDNVPKKMQNVTVSADATPHATAITIVDTYCNNQHNNADDLIERTFFPPAQQLTASTSATPPLPRQTSSSSSAASQYNQQTGIILVCSTDLPESIQRVTSYWLPLLQQHDATRNIPVTLAINKATTSVSGSQSLSSSGLLHDDTHNQPANTAVTTLVEQFEQLVKTFQLAAVLPCSAKYGINISNIFWECQRSILYPVHPLYDSHTSTLKPAFSKALLRGLRLFDTTGTDTLDATALNNWQLVMYNRPMKHNTIDDILAVLKQQQADSTLPLYTEDNAETRPTFAGFTELHRQIILQNRCDTIWQMLTRLGYTHDLQISEHYVKLPELQHLDWNDSTVEWSTAGISYLTQLFNLYDRDGDQCLSHTQADRNTPSELQSLFLASTEIPFASTTSQYIPSSADNSGITLDGFLSHFTALLSRNPIYTLQQICYTSFNTLPDSSTPTSIHAISHTAHERLATLINILPSRKADRRRHRTQRHVVQLTVAATVGINKSRFMSHLIGKQQSQPAPTLTQRSASSSSHSSATSSPRVTGINVNQQPPLSSSTQSKLYTTPVHSFSDSSAAPASPDFVLLREFPANHSKTALKYESLRNDLLVILYDSSNKSSASYVQDLLAHCCNAHVPAVVVLMRKDAAASHVSGKASRLSLTGAYDVRVIQYDSATSHTAMLEQLHEAANQPAQHVPVNRLQRSKRRKVIIPTVLSSVVIGAVSALLYARRKKLLTI